MASGKVLFLDCGRRAASKQSIPLKNNEEKYNHKYKTLFDDYLEGVRAFVSPHSLLRMRIENVEVSWIELRFKSKAQCNQSYDAWLQTVMSMTEVLKKIY